MKSIAHLLFVAGILATGISSGRADTITWNGTVSSSWNNPTNWTPQEVPTTNDHVIIASGSVTTASTNGAFAILDWSGGTITGPLTVISNAVLNISWNILTSWNGALTNAGTVNITGTGQLNMSTGPINNLPGGIIDFKANEIWTGLTPVAFYNAGLVRKTAGTGTTQIGYPGFSLNFTNTGTVEADSGTIGFYNDARIDGTYQASNSAAISFAQGAFTPGINPVIAGTGTVKFTGTTLTLPTNTIPGLQMLGGTVYLGPAFQGGSITNLAVAGSLLATTNIITGTLSVVGGFTGPLTVAAGGVFNWTNGTGTGPLNVLTNGLLNIAWSTLNNWIGSLTNAGMVTITGSGQLNMSSGPINNLPNGIIDFKANVIWTGFSPITLYNAGLVRKTAGTGVVQIGLTSYPITFVNSGTVEADIGTIMFNSGGQMDGTYLAVGNGIIDFALGTFTPVNPLFTGSGTNEFTGTTLNLPANIIPGLQMLSGTINLGPAFQGGSITNLTLLSPVLGGTNIVTGTLNLANGFTGALTIAAGGTFNWTNGTGTGPINVLSNGTLNIAWNNLTDWTGSLTNAGMVLVTGSGQLNMFTGPINNLTNGIIDFKSNPNWTGLTPITFYNAGTVRKTAGTGVVQIGLTSYPITFVNSGTVEADIGTITFNSGGQMDGTYLAVGNGIINFALGTFTALNPVFSGSGTNEFTGTTLILAYNVLPGLKLLGGTIDVGPLFQGGSITNLVLPGITLGGTNIVSGSATLNGGFTGVLTVASNGVASQPGGTSVGALVVAGGGTYNWSGGTIGTTGPAGSSINVLANGTLNISWNVLSYLYGPLTNAGLVTVTAAGQFNIAGGPINNLASGVMDFRTNFVWTGYIPTTFYNAGLVRKSGGFGTSQIGLGSYPIFFTNTTGTVEADTGTLNFNFGGYQDTPAAYIAASLGGASAGTNYGLISFFNPPVLNASLVASTRNGFLPSRGQTFRILSYPSSTNQFNGYTNFDLGSGVLLQPQFSTNGLTLLVANYSTNAVLPQLFINRSLGGAAIVWPAAFTSWTLQTTTNLSSPAWVPVAGVSGNVALIPGTPPQYFRLHN